MSLNYALKPKIEDAETTVYTYDQIAKHSSIQDAWTVYEGRVYDVSEYAKKHPGGIKKLMMGVGQDCTQMFKEAHAYINCHYILGRYQVGIIT